MRRKRYQFGSVSVSKRVNGDVWIFRWRENGAKKSRILGMVAEMSKERASELAEMRQKWENQ